MAFLEVKIALNLFVLIVGLLLANNLISTTGQVVGAGRCPKVAPMKNFNVSAYAGLWYEIEKYWFLFESTSSCVRVEYIDNKNGDFGVEINMFENTLRRTMTNPGLTRFLSDDGSAKLELDIEITQSPVPFVVKYPYMVLDTDYSTYTIKWTCVNAGLMNMQNLWILSKSKTIPPKSKKIVYNTLKALGISTNNLQKSNTTRCS